MRVYVHREKEEIVQGVDYARAITSLRFKRRDRGNLEVVFTDGSSVVELPDGATGKVALKAKDAYTSGALAMAGSWTKSGTGAATVYAFDFNLNTEAIDTAFAGETLANLPKIDVMFEIEWREGGTRIASTATIYADLYNDVIRGDEGTPLPGDPPVLNEEETLDRIIRNLSAITALTGGAAGALDAVPTVGVPVSRMVAVEISGLAYIYRLEAGTTAESAPTVIRPDDYHASTNAKVWRLKGHYLHSPHFNGTPTFEVGVPAGWRDALALDTNNSINVTATGAGNTNIVPAAGFRFVEAILTAEAGSGAYTRNVVLQAPLGAQICTVNLLLHLAADNPTISIRNLTAGGTELLNIPPTDSARSAAVVLRSRDGATWELFSAQFNP